MLTVDVLKKLDTDTQEAIFNAQIAELVERRKIQDPALFRYCIWQEIPEDFQWPETIDNFQWTARDAFKRYHDLRIKCATLDAEGNLVIPEQPDDTPAAPAQDADTAEASEEPSAEDGE